MPDPSPRLHAVGESEPRRPRARRPGLAVILIAVYGLCFAAALWWMRGAAARAHASKNDGDAPPAAGDSRSAPTREQLLSGAGLDPRARPEYARRLATDCCDCGCDLTLHDCLVGDQKCVRSAQIAQKIWSGSK